MTLLRMWLLILGFAVFCFLLSGVFLWFTPWGWVVWPLIAVYAAIGYPLGLWIGGRRVRYLQDRLEAAHAAWQARIDRRAVILAKLYRVSLSVAEGMALADDDSWPDDDLR